MYSFMSDPQVDTAIAEIMAAFDESKVTRDKGKFAKKAGKPWTSGGETAYGRMRGAPAVGETSSYLLQRAIIKFKRKYGREPESDADWAEVDPAGNGDPGVNPLVADAMKRAKRQQ